MTSLLLFVLFTNLLVIEINSKPTGYEYETQNDGLGNSNFRYALNDGTVREETVRHAGDDPAFVSGYYSFIGTDGKQYNVHYTADEHGFKPEISVVEAGLDIGPDIASNAISSLQGGGLG